MSFWKTFKDTIGLEDNDKNNNAGDLLDVEAGQNRLTMIGTMGAGKSVHLAGLLIAADRKVSKSRGTDHPFRYFIDEGSANIENDKSALRAGHFPPKTGAMKSSSVEPASIFEWSHVKNIAGKEITLSKRQAKMSMHKIFLSAIKWWSALEEMGDEGVLNEIQDKASELAAHFQDAVSEVQDIIAPATEAANDVNAIIWLVLNALKAMGAKSRGMTTPLNQVFTAQALVQNIVNEATAE